MPVYKNKSNRSGVTNYELDDDGINVTFKNGKTYRYPADSNGPYTISRMHAMAENGEYLNRMINAEKPSFEGQSGMNAVVGDIRKLRSVDEKSMRGIHNKYIFGKPKLKEAIAQATRKKMASAGSYKEWMKFR